MTRQLLALHRRSNTMSLNHAVLLVAILGFCVMNASAWALGQETTGNQPLAEQSDYQSWPGVMKLINDTSRVYSRWVNGNEHFYYRGDTSVLNGFLARFAAMESPVRELILLPGPGRTETFDGEEVKADWRLHIVGGILASTVKRENKAEIWDVHPTVTVYVTEDGGIQLDKLTIPKGIDVLEIADVRKRFREGLKNENPNARADAAYLLATEDNLNEENVALIADLLKDEDSHARASAAACLGWFGSLAASALPDLKAACEDKEQQVREIATANIEKIESGVDQTSAVAAYQGMENSIREFRQQLEEDNASETK